MDTGQVELQQTVARFCADRFPLDPLTPVGRFPSIPAGPLVAGPEVAAGLRLRGTADDHALHLGSSLVVAGR